MKKRSENGRRIFTNTLNKVRVIQPNCRVNGTLKSKFTSTLSFQKNMYYIVFFSTYVCIYRKNKKGTCIYYIRVHDRVSSNLKFYFYWSHFRRARSKIIENPPLKLFHFINTTFLSSFCYFNFLFLLFCNLCKKLTSWLLERFIRYLIYVQ